jgi:CBS domain-containing protein
MKVGELCGNNPVFTVGSRQSLREAAQLMREKRVGALVVVDDSSRRPVGMLTDRDIVVAVVAVQGAVPDAIRAGDAMSTPLASLREDDGVLDAAARMRQCGVRRLAVLDSHGRLAGIVALDDLLAAVSAGLSDLSEALRRGRRQELEARPAAGGVR